jgi:hypothetical protein
LDFSSLNPAQLEAVKLCECGCGRPAPIIKKTHRARGRFKGQPARFIAGHNLREYRGEKSSNWKGGRYKIKPGYILINTGPGRRRFEHQIVAERMLGRLLKPGEIVHHKNGNKGDNSPENLEVYNQSHHAKIHAISNTPVYLPNKKLCPNCQAIKQQAEFSKSKNRADGLNGWCKSCQGEAKLRWKNARKNVV